MSLKSYCIIIELIFIPHRWIGAHLQNLKRSAEWLIISSLQVILDYKWARHSTESDGLLVHYYI